MNIRKWLKTEQVIGQERNRMAIDQKKYSRLSKNQVNFFDNDKKTQELLNEYERVIKGDSETNSVAKIVEQVGKSENLWLYLQNRINRKLTSKSENNSGGGENKG